MIAWYEGLLADVFGGDATITDRTLTDYSGDRSRRKDVVFILDTSDVGSE